MEETKQNKLASLGFITAVLLLLLNDFYLKSTYHNVFTGKLSNFAGLFAFSYFFTIFFPKKKKWIYSITLLLFVCWKSPLSEGVISIWNSWMPYRITRVIDYSDLYALSILPLSYLYEPTQPFFQRKYLKKGIAIGMCWISVFSFLATSAGTHGNIKRYKLKESKSDVNDMIQTFYKNELAYHVPDKYSRYTWHYGGDSTINDEWIQEANADTVSFSFFLKEENIILWTGFSGLADNWKEDNCELVLIGYIEVGKKWKFNNDLTKQERLEITTKFENEILKKIGLRFK